MDTQHADGVEQQPDRRSTLPRPHLLAAALVVLFVLIGLVLVELLRPELLTDPRPWLEDAGSVAAALGVGLLVADVLVPAPSSVVMVELGALFGVVPGALLSLAGATGATLVAFAVGRRGRSMIARREDAEQQAAVRRFVARSGLLALVVTRPVPVLAETVAVLAGATPMPWRTALLGSVLGNLVPAVVYAVAGSYARGLADQLLVLGLVLLLSAGLWLVSRKRLR